MPEARDEQKTQVTGTDEFALSLYTGLMSVFFLVTYVTSVPMRNSLPYVPVLAVIAGAALLTAWAVYRGKGEPVLGLTWPLLSMLSFLMCGFVLYSFTRECGVIVRIFSALEFLIFAVIGTLIAGKIREG